MENFNSLESIKSYLAKSYDFDILTIRCAKSGRVRYSIADDELLAMADLCDYDLVKLSERLERIHSFSNTSPLWLFEDDNSLDKLRYTQPKDFFCYAIKELVSLNSYYATQRLRANGMFTSTGRYLLNSDFNIFMEAFDKLYANGGLPSSELNDLNEKLLLLLSIGATSQIESLINSELTFDWVMEQLANSELLNKFSKLLNQIINKFKLKNGYAFDHKLTINDINKLAKQRALQKENETKAQNEWLAKLRATNASYFQKVKTSRSGYKRNEVTSLMENLIGELMLANKDKRDYIDQLTMKRASLIVNGKDTSKLNALAKRAMSQVKSSQATQSNGLKQVKLTNLVIINSQATKGDENNA